MVRTSSTPAAASRPRSSSARPARLIRSTPGRSATDGSTSWGSARSMTASGRSSPARAVTTSPRRTSGSGAPVHDTTRSAWGSSSARADSGADEAPYSAASRSALADGAVEHGDAGGTAAGEVGGGEGRHRARADHERAGTRDGHRAALERGADQRRGGPVDVGLGVGALADAQGLLEERVERRADRAVLLAEPQGVTGLAEDLALADDHRVEAGGDLEEVGDRALVVVDVEVRQQRLGGLLGPRDEEAGEVLDAAVEAVDLGIDLEPVARDDRGGLGDVLAGDDVGDQLGRRVGVEGEPLEQLDGRGLVGDPHARRTLATTHPPIRARPPCAARGRPGSAARSTGRPCVRRRPRAPRGRSARS